MMENIIAIQEVNEAAVAVQSSPTTALATTFAVEDESCANCTSLITDENTKAMIADRETVDATELAVYIRKSIVHVKKTFKLTKPLAIELKRRFDNLDRTKQVDGTYLKIDGAKSLNAWLELYAHEIGSKRNFYYIIDEKQAVGTDYLAKPAFESGDKDRDDNEAEETDIDTSSTTVTEADGECTCTPCLTCTAARDAADKLSRAVGLAFTRSGNVTGKSYVKAARLASDEYRKLRKIAAIDFTPAKPQAKKTVKRVKDKVVTGKKTKKKETAMEEAA
jgi:hypothetical protein